MDSFIQRGKLVYLTPEAHRRLRPAEPREKIGKRPFLIVQADYLNEKSDQTIVVRLTGSSKVSSANAFVPKMAGLATSDCCADCGAVYTVREKDINAELSKERFSGAYGVRNTDGVDVMDDVADALRFVMELDPDGNYRHSRTPKPKQKCKQDVQFKFKRRFKYRRR